MRMTAYLAIVAIGLVSASCDKEKKNKGYVFKTELARLGSAAALNLASPVTPTDNSAYTWTSEINIESLKIPIVRIALGNYSGRPTASIYSCEADCTVDLMGPELTNLLKDKDVATTDSGTFDQIWVSAIESGNSADLWEGKIKASFVLEGVTYYTKSDDSLSTTAPAEEATFRYNGGRMDSFLPEPITLGGENGSPVSMNIKLFFDPLYLSFALDSSKVSQGVTNAIGSGPWCIGSNGGVKLCVQRMQVTASTDAATPTRERYIVNDSGLLSLLVDSADNILGGSFMPRFQEGLLFKGFKGGVVSDYAPDNRTWATGSLATVSSNTDGTYTVSNMAPEDATTAGEGGGFRATQFKRASHSGTYVSSSGTEYSYSAVKM